MRVPLFVYDPVMVALGIVTVPLNVFDAPEKVYTEVPGITVPLFVILPLTLTVSFTYLCIVSCC